MKRTNLFRKYTLILCSVLLGFSAGAQVLFETNFQASEGWVTEGSASSTSAGVIIEKTITYNDVPYLFKLHQVAVNVTDGPNGECSQGSASIQKNGKNDYLQVSTQATNNGYILLPDFNEDIQISFGHGSGTTRRIALETSLDDGLSWQVKEDDIAPLLASGCAEFKSPSKFTKDMKVRITNHTNGGGLKIYWFRIEKFVADEEAPVVVLRNPEVDSVEVSPSIREITLDFNEPVKPGGDGKVYVVGNTSGEILELTSDALIFNQTHVTIPFTNTFFLNHNEMYTVLLEKGSVKDLANNPAEEIMWNFTTKEVVSNEKEILSVKIPKMVGTPVINSAAATVDIKLGFGSDLANIQPATILFEISPLATIINDYKDFSSGPQVYKVIAEDRTEKDWTVTITVAEFKPASLPVVYKGDVEQSWKNIVADGWTIQLVNDDGSTKMNNYQFYQAALSQANHYLKNQFNGEANRVSFRARYGNNTSNFKLDVQESVDGEEWTSIVSYVPSNLELSDLGVVLKPTATDPDPTPMIPTTSSSLGLRSYPVLPTSRYIRWYYTTRTNTTFYVDDVVIENAPIDVVAPTYISEQPVTVVNYSNNSKSQIVFRLSETAKVSPALIARTSGIRIEGGTTDIVVYEPNILTFRNGDVVLTDLPALTDSTQYTVTIPGDVLVDLANNAFAGTTFNFTYEIETGLHNPVKKDVSILQLGDQLFVQDAAQLQLYNLVGGLIRTSGAAIMNISGIEQGAYIVRYQLTGGAVGASKIIIRK